MIYVLTGATGTGKSRIAVELAKKIGGEIVNADAFQVYEGLKIATAYPDEKDMKEVPHHLYGFVPLNEAYSNTMASRGTLPVLSPIPRSEQLTALQP